jgi:hypothetical protein
VSDAQQKLSEIEELRQRIARLEDEAAGAIGREPTYPPRSYYTIYHLLAGMVLGLIAAASSLVFNIVGSAMVGQHPLQLIRVYLTFPLGEKALELESGFALAAGCCLYLATGMIGGIPFHLMLTRYFSGSSGWVRFLAACALGLGVWLINFYGILYWLQPLLIGGRWIVERVPVIVAVLTHMVFGLTMLLVSQWGQYTPPAESARRTPA